MPSLLLFAPFLILQAPASASADSAAFYRGLDRGTHTVGYRSMELVDRARHDSAAAGPVAPRRLAVHVWFPAQRSTGRTLRFSELTGRSLPALADHAVELGGARGVAQAGIQRLGAIGTWSRAGVSPIAGRHPLVLVPSWLAPGTVSVMAEVLASHGFVVATVPHRGTDAVAPEFNVRNLESQATDLQFTVQELSRLPFVDDARVAVMGTGINASGALLFAMRSARVGALVSLEGGITTPFEQRMIRTSPYFDPRRVRTPILAITAPHPDVDAARLDIYRNAMQHRVHFAGSGEFWMLNFGPMNAVVPSVIGTPPGDVHTAFVTATRYVERFLSTYLRGDDDARRFLTSPPGTLGIPPNVVTVETRPVRAPALSREAVFGLLATSGAEGLARRVREELRRETD
ncbi:MAG: hypothetical protein H7066_12430, partial [Cytophagaceae bacterium]|nr:hypothetical protein [Gemmatimonadaceae bacterium]